jgi:ferredoxin-NADP reductase
MRSAERRVSEFVRVRVERVSQVAESVREFVLRPVSRAAVAPWRAGAHIRVRAQTMDGRAAERRYSLVGAAGDPDRLRIAVLRGHDHGVAAHLHDRVGPGDELRVSQPGNDFGLHSKPHRALLIAGGIGITPLLPMARELAVSGDAFELHYAARSLAAMAYRGDVEALGAERVVRLYPGDQGRRLDITALAAHWQADHQVYVCGPRSLIEQVRRDAAAVGLPEAQVHFESFGSAVRALDRGFEVELRRARRTLRVAAGQTILHAAAEAGIHAEADCERGECGVCAVRVIEGEVDHRDLCLSSADRHVVRLMTPCVSRAIGQRLVLDM